MRRYGKLAAALLIGMLASTDAAAAVPGWHARPLLVFTLAWWTLLVVCRPQQWEPYLWWAVGLALRVTLTQSTHLHVDKGFALQLGAVGRDVVAWDYGDAWAALLSWPHLLFGADVAMAPPVAAFVASLGIPLIWVAGRSIEPQVGRWATGLFTLSPLLIATAGTDTRFTVAMVLQVAALAGVVRHDKRGAWFAALSIGLLAHTRPLQGILAAVLALALLPGKHKGSLALVGLFFFTRVGWWATNSLYTSGLQLHTLTFGSPWLSPVGRDGAVVLLDPTRTPWVLPILAVFGLVYARQHQHRLLGLAAVLATLNVVLYGHQPAIADRLRFELPAQAMIALLAAAGAVHLIGKRPRWVPALVVVTGLSWWPARTPYPPYPWQTEHAALRRAAALVPAGATVVYDRRFDSSSKIAHWLEAMSQAHWVGRTDSIPDEAWIWVGIADAADGAPPFDPGRHPVVFTVQTAPDWGGLEGYGPWDPTQPLRLTLYGPVPEAP